MKMVKSLLLGSAAALVAATAGQAADLPVKAKPVEYVKVCSLYGAGFYYMPGTDMCIKIGGWVRVEATWGNNNGNMAWGPFAGQENNRFTNNFVMRERGYITADAREQTAYGTARAYIDVGLSDSTIASNGGGTGTFSSNRAFLQWAGFTAGLTQSFYDFYSAAAMAYRAAYMPIEDTGDGGQWVWAYTAQFGNGLTATISAEARRNTQIIGANDDDGGAETVSGSLVGTPLYGSSGPFPGYGGNQVPDIVGNLRVDQTWGSAQVMGALHQVNAQYYDQDENNDVGFGHPSDAWGWVLGAGLRLNFPMIAQGDYFQGEVNYTQGGLRYLNQPTQANYENQQSNTGAYGVMSDCVYSGVDEGAAPGSSCQLTTAWSVNAGYEHYWTPSVHESFVGAYEAVSYNSQANGILCVLEKDGNGAITGVGVFSAAPGCDNNWSTWGASSRLQWDVTKSFYLGVEVMYNHLNSAKSFNGLVPSGIASIGASPGPFPNTIGGASENAWNVTVRMHKDFLP
jgi:Porin subfamily